MSLYTVAYFYFQMANELIYKYMINENKNKQANKQKVILISQRSSVPNSGKIFSMHCIFSMRIYFNCGSLVCLCVTYGLSKYVTLA